MPGPDERARRLRSPDGLAWLLDDTVFQFNDQYRRFWRRGGDSLGRPAPGEPSDAAIVPVPFDKASRTFNWIAIADTVLEPDQPQSDDAAVSERQAALEAAIISLHSRLFAHGDAPGPLDWKTFSERFSDSPHCDRALEILTEELGEYHRRDAEGRVKYFRELREFASEERLFSIFHSIYTLYSSYSHPNDHYLEGIFYDILFRFGHSKPEAVEHAVFGELSEKIIDGFSHKNWLDLSLWKAARGVDYEFDGRSGDAELTMAGSGYSPSRREETSVTEEAFLVPLLTGRKTGAGGWTFARRLAEHRYLLLVPLYDVWVGSSGYGGIQAVLLIFVPVDFGGDPATSPWALKYQELLRRCEPFAREVAATSIRRALATPIRSPYDLVRHFLSILHEVQDWEEAVVFYDGRADFRFKRKPKVPGGDHRWRGVRTPWEVDGDFDPGEDNARLEGPHRQFGGMQEHDGDHYMWWTCEDGSPAEAPPHHDLWDRYFLSDLTADERAAFRGTSIRFKFPKACRIPPKDDPEARAYLAECYLRQQLELMRALLPKVRARRAALRNAVSAIMGRNMSHNIGSHVLARYAAAIGDHERGPDANPDPRADFLNYLQRRMDFLAEVATSDRSYWTQPLALSDQIARLNYETQLERFYGDAVEGDEGRHTPLLKYITGKEGLHANVAFAHRDGQASLLFASPGGEVGVHALYVIVENIIRNSARHNGQAGGRVEIEIEVTTEQQAQARAFLPARDWEGLIELRVVDTRTVLRADGTPAAVGGPSGAAWDYVGGEALRKKWRSLPGDDKDKLFSALPDRINWIIQHEPLLDADGAPNPNFWGIREMQVCAQYLRQLQLSDLEDVPYADHDSAVKKVPLIRAECVPHADGYRLAYVIYLRAAKLLATIEPAKDPGAPQGALAAVTPNFGRLALSAAALQAGSDAARPPELQKALNDLRNYAFVAHAGDEATARWVEAHREDLPVRRVAWPSEGAAAPFRDSGGGADPEALMESLHEAYARRLHGTARPLAGLVIAKDAQLCAVAERPGLDVSQPVSVKAQQNAWTAWCFANLRDHGDFDACLWLDHPNTSAIEAFRKEREGKRIRLLSWEACFSHSPATEAVCALKPGTGWELMAASLPRVAVLDERVQAEGGRVVRDTQIRLCWEGMRVAVPDKVAGETERPAPVNLDHPDFASCRRFLKSLSHEVDFLVVHLTILERLASTTGRAIPAALHDLVEGTRAANAEIMIVTGRGVPTFARTLGDDWRAAPPELAKRIRYLPISALLEYLVHRPSKLGLMRALWSASRPARGG